MRPWRLQGLLWAYLVSLVTLLVVGLVVGIAWASQGTPWMVPFLVGPAYLLLFFALWAHVMLSYLLAYGLIRNAYVMSEGTSPLPGYVYGVSLLPIVRLFWGFRLLREVWRASGAGDEKPLNLWWAAVACVEVISVVGSWIGFVAFVSALDAGRDPFPGWLLLVGVFAGVTLPAAVLGLVAARRCWTAQAPRVRAIRMRRV